MQKCLIRDVRISGCKYGVYLGGDYNSIVDSRFEDCTGSGVYNDGSSHALIAHNFYSSSADGISLQNPYFNRVIGNWVYAPTRDGILVGLSDAAHCLIEGNMVVGGYGALGSGSNGIRVGAGGSNVKVLGNYVVWNRDHGVEFRSDDCSAEGNTVAYNGKAGIRGDGASRLKITANKIYNNVQSGGTHSAIELAGTGRGYKISENQIYDNQGGKAAQLDGIGWAATHSVLDVSNNDVSGTPSAATRGINGSWSATGIRLSNNSGFATAGGGITAPMATGSTVVHGLSRTPSWVIVVPAESGPTNPYVTSVGPTTFTVNFGGGGRKTFFWQAGYGSR
jgi:hypothetical protein